MGKKVRATRPSSAKVKRVTISEIDQEPSKSTASERDPKAPIKSALKTTVKQQNKDAKAGIEDGRNQEKKSKDDPINNQVESVFLDGFEDEGSAEEDSDDDSSEDDQDESGNKFKQSSAFNPKDLPTSKFATKVQNDKSSKQQKMEARSGVVYLGRIPHGFYEEEMRAYFNQFGEVIRLRLSRSKKTGKPKHYGFIEFKHHQVAQIVAETLNNYLLCGNLLQCQLLDQHQIHSKLWIGAGSKFRKDCKIRLHRERRNEPKTLENQKVISDRLIEREQKKRKRLVELGIDYDFPGYVNPTKSKPSELKESVVENVEKKKKVTLENQATDSSKKKIRSQNSKRRSKKLISSTG